MLKTVSIVLMVAMGLVACDGAEQKQSNEQKVNVSETASQTERTLYGCNQQGCLFIAAHANKPATLQGKS